MTVTIGDGLSYSDGVSLASGVSPVTGTSMPIEPGGASQQTYPELVMSQVPRAYWRFEEAAGTNANDETANNHDGTYTGVTINQAGFVKDSAKSIQCTGVAGNTVIIPTHVLPETGATGACSFKFWLKNTNTGIQVLWDKRGNTGAADAANRILIAINRNTAGANVAGMVTILTRASDGITNNFGNSAAFATLNDSNRHQLVFVLNGDATGAVYYDGAPVATVGAISTGQLHAASATGRNGHLISGLDAGTLQAFCMLDEYAVYRKALTAQEVLADYTLGVS